MEIIISVVVLKLFIVFRLFFVSILKKLNRNKEITVCLNTSLYTKLLKINLLRGGKKDKFFSSVNDTSI